MGWSLIIDGSKIDEDYIREITDFNHRSEVFAKSSRVVFFLSMLGLVLAYWDEFVWIGGCEVFH